MPVQTFCKHNRSTINKHIGLVPIVFAAIFMKPVAASAQNIGPTYTAHITTRTAYYEYTSPQTAMPIPESATYTWKYADPVPTEYTYFALLGLTDDGGQIIGNYWFPSVDTWTFGIHSPSPEPVTIGHTFQLSEGEYNISADADIQELQSVPPARDGVTFSIYENIP